MAKFNMRVHFACVGYYTVYAGNLNHAEILAEEKMLSNIPDGVDYDIDFEEFDPKDFEPKIVGQYQQVISASPHPQTTNGWYKRSMHDSIAGMYYTNPDDPCYTLDNSGYEKEFRSLSNKAQILSVPQKIFGSQIKKGSVEITSGSGINKITLKDDGFGNLYDVSITGSVVSGSVVVSQSISYVSKSILTLNWNDMFNQDGETVTAHSMPIMIQYKPQTFKELGKGGFEFDNLKWRRDLRKRTRFFERSRFANKIKMYKGLIANPGSAGNNGDTIPVDEGTCLLLDGQYISSYDTSTHSASFLEIEHEEHLTLTRDDNYTVAMRLSCSAEQPSTGSVQNHIFILHKQEYTGGGSGYPFSLRLISTNNTNPVYGIPGHLQGQMRVMGGEGGASSFIKVNTIAPVTESGWIDVHMVKSGSKFSMYLDGALQGTASIPAGGEVHSEAPITLGCKRYWNGQYTTVANQSNTNPPTAGSTQQVPSYAYNCNFKGGVSNFSIFSDAQEPVEIQYWVETKGKMNNLVGNVFYNHGLITLTSIASRYDNDTANGTMFSECTLSLENTHEIYEHQYNCHVKEREYTYTMNPTIVENKSKGTLKHFCSQSSWTPYVTTIGLYDSHARLMAIGKLSSPVKQSEDYDTTYVIRFDT